MSSLFKSPSEKEAQQIARQLLSFARFQRDAGEKQLEELQGKQPEFFIELLDCIRESDRAGWRDYAGSFWINLCMASLFAYGLSRWLHDPMLLWVMPLCAIFADLIFTLPLKIQGIRARKQNAKEKVVLLLTQNCDNVRVCGILIEYIEFAAPTQQVVRRTLKNLLHRLQTEHHNLFNAHQRLCLYRALKSDDTDFILSLLHAIEQIGDEKGIPYVERLLKSTNGTEPYANAATDCLNVLKARAEEIRAVQTLLRPSQQENAAPETLLRPATGQNADEKQQQTLLRPAGE